MGLLHIIQKRCVCLGGRRRDREGKKSTFLRFGDEKTKKRENGTFLRFGDKKV